MGKRFSGEDFPLEHGVTPEISAAAAPAIGEIIIGWGFIESNLRGIYWTLERVGGVGKGVPYTTSEAKVEVLLDIVKQAGEKIDVLRTDDLGDALVEAVGHAKHVANVRNVVAHWQVVQAREKPKPALRFVQWRGDNWRSVWKDHWYTIDELELYAQRAKGLGSAFGRLALEAINRIEPDRPTDSV